MRQGVAVRMPGILLQLPRRRFLRDLACVQHHDSLRPRGDHLHVVTDYQQAESVLIAQPFEQAEKIRPRSGIQRSRRLVCDQHSGPAADGLSDGDPLPLAAAQLVGA